MAYAVLRRDTLLKTSEIAGRWRNLPCPKRDTAVCDFGATGVAGRKPTTAAARQPPATSACRTYLIECGPKSPRARRVRPVLEMIRTNPLTGENHEALAFVFGNGEGEAIASPKKAWEVCVLKAHGIKPEWVRPTHRLSEAVPQETCGDRLALARPATRGWQPMGRGRLADSPRPADAGHADLKQTSTYLNAIVSGIEESMRRMDLGRGLLQSVAINPAPGPLPDCNLSREVPAKELVS